MAKYSGVPMNKGEGAAKVRDGAALLDGRYAKLTAAARRDIDIDHWRENARNKPYPGGFDALWNSKRSQ